MKIRLLVLALAVCMIATPAFADLYGTVSLDWNGLVIGYNQLGITSPAGPGGYVENDVGLHSLTLGALNTATATHTLPSDSYLVAGSIEAFCIDLYDNFPTSTTTYDAMSLDAVPDSTSGGPMGDSAAKYVAQLLNTNTYATVNDAAAMQVAVWEVIYDGTNFNVTEGSGNFYLDTVGGLYGEATIAGLANTMLSGLAQASSYSEYTALSHDTGKEAQDFVLVPVPGAVLLGILGLGVVGLKLRKYA